MGLPSVFVIVLLVFVSYVLMAYVTKFIARVFSVCESIVIAWMTGVKLTDKDITNSWYCFEKEASMAEMNTIFTVFWPMGIILMILVAVVGIPYAIYLKVKRVVSVPSISVKLRPNWWHVSNLTRILNKFL